jgi:hypothetical protein
MSSTWTAAEVLNQKLEVKTGRWRGDPTDGLEETELTASGGVIGPGRQELARRPYWFFTRHHQVDDASRIHDLGLADVPEPPAFHWPLIRRLTTAARISCSRQRLRTFA